MAVQVIDPWVDSGTLSVDAVMEVVAVLYQTLDSVMPSPLEEVVLCVVSSSFYHLLQLDDVLEDRLLILVENICLYQVEERGIHEEFGIQMIVSAVSR